ncbi:ArsR/SmtB family transcription factor [Bifidobacterium pseudolongum]|uniref:ArsR family transcriptional regulator n=1 Tax=Bifidobacterium pseudolongum subsp. globosum TaxID=1690 RepID=A0A2N3R6V6_9BIFI|nr:helix-turn-helix domain-containing protein [Bifidobacterium pseudolongum]PKV05083.1 ArsR family transcriptional regulator [Bifidobacterium pseudolongum subsp. globosum]
MMEQRMKVDDGPAPAESEEALKCMAHPARMRLLGALRVGGVQTVGELSAATGEAPGAVSYHLAQLAKVGLVAKAASPDGDKRKSYWKSCHHATNVQPDSADADVIDAFSRTAALTYQMAYERFLDVLPTLQQEWAQTCGANDRVLLLTAEETRAMVEDLNAVMRTWERLSDERRTTMAPSDPACSAAAQAGAQAQAAATAAEPVAVVQQVFRWVP